MAKPLSDEQVTYDDGSPQTVDQYARDVSAFLMWAAEPHLEARKQTGFSVIVFMLLFGATGLSGEAQGMVWCRTLTPAFLWPIDGKGASAPFCLNFEG